MCQEVAMKTTLPETSVAFDAWHKKLSFVSVCMSVNSEVRCISNSHPTG